MRLSLLAVLAPLASCSDAGFGTYTHIFGPGMEDTETYEFSRASFDACPGCDWHVRAYEEDESGSYTDGVGWDQDAEALFIYTIPGSSIDDVRSGWGLLLDRPGLEAGGYTVSASFTEDALDLRAEKDAFAPNSCVDYRGEANGVFSTDEPSGSLTGELTCGQYAKHVVEVPANQRVRVWIQTDVQIVPKLWLAAGDCLASGVSATIPCNAGDVNDNCPAMVWRSEQPTTLTVVLDVAGWTCDEKVPYTLFWTGETATVGASTPTADPSPALAPYVDTYVVDFDI